MNSDGKVVIGTELDTKGFDKKYESLKTRLENEEIKLKVKSDDLENARQELQKVQQELENVKRKRDEINKEVKSKQSQYETLNQRISGGEALTGDEYQRFAFLDNTLSKLKAEQEQINAEYDKYNDKLNKSYDLLTKSEAKYDIQKNKVEQLQGEFQELNTEISKTTNRHLAKMNNSLEGIGSSIFGVVKKVGKWALAVFGIRSAYMFVRQAMSTLSQYNEQMATDVEYIRFAIATTLQPVIEYIIKLVYQLLGLINSIAKAWFGVDLFANASADAFNKNKKAINGTNKSAKELQKTLAGFDEMNILQDNGSTSVGGGGGGIVSPSFDLSKVGNMDLGDIDKLLERIKLKFSDVFDTIKNNILNVFRDLGFSEEFIDIFGGMLEGFKKAIMGLFDFIIGGAKIVVGFLTGDTELVKQGFDQAINGIKNLVLGLIKYWINNFMLLPQLTVDIMKDIANGVYEQVIVPIGKWFKELPDRITADISNGVKNINNWFAKIPDKLREIKDKVVEIFSKMANFVGNAVGDAFKAVLNAVINRAETVLNRPISTINALIGTINQIPGVYIGKLANFKLPRLAQGGILNMPGRGVMVGSAIAGERGQEGVIPLTDSQQMALLGEAIGRYITVNLTNVTELDGRTIARKVQEVNNNTNFLLNR